MEVLSVIKHSLVSDGINPIAQHFRLVRQVASAGREMVWKIYDAVRIKDGKEASVFLFEKRIADKLHKPKRREIVTDILRRDIINLSRYKHPKILRVVHCLEECNDSLAFATEPVAASLANLLGNYDRIPLSNLQDIKDYSFIETEQKYGILQLAEALHHLHTVERILHMNVSPENILITKKGMWKLAGFGFIQSLDSGIKDANAVHPWSSKQSKMAQPDLDFMAPEVQLETVKTASPVCDMFSFGMVICSIYNNGRSLIQAGYNPANYSKQLDRISDTFGDIAPRLPVQLVEPVERMINHDTRYRPSTQSFIMLKYFDDPVVHCMETMDSIDTRNVSQKRDFFSLLQQTIPLFPRKLLYNSVLKLIREQFEYPDMLVLLLPVLIALIDNSTDDDYRNILQHDLKKVISMNRPVQATVYLLENLEVILAKVSEEETRSDILPIVFGTLDSNSIQGQEAAISVFSSIKKYIDDETMKRLVLPKAKALYCKSTNVRTKQNALECLDRLLDSLDKMTILEEVLPFLTEIQCTDVDIIMSVVAIYKHLLSDKKYGLTHSLLATKVMPTVVPLTVTPGLSIEQFSALMEVLHDMLDQIERQRLSKMVNEIPDHEDLEKRRTAIDMRNRRNDTSQVMKANPSSASLGNKSVMLNIDGKYLTQSRQPSNPELIITNGSEESLQAPKTNKRRSSFQGLGAVEQMAVENAVRQRRASILSSQIHPSALANNPHILVSEPSVTDFKESSFFACSGSSSRRASTASTGPILVPDGSRRDSFGHIVAQGHSSSRRSSFQGICDSAMQLFKSK